MKQQNQMCRILHKINNTDLVLVYLLLVLNTVLCQSVTTFLPINLSKNFVILTLVPSNAPSYQCRPGGEFYIECEIYQISIDNWNGKPHGYEIFWIPTDELLSWNLTSILNDTILLR